MFIALSLYLLLIKEIISRDGCKANSNISACSNKPVRLGITLQYGPLNGAAEAKDVARMQIIANIY